MFPREKGIKPQYSIKPALAEGALTMISEMTTSSSKMSSCWMLKSFSRVSTLVIPPVACTVLLAYCSSDALMVLLNDAVLLPQTSVALKYPIKPPAPVKF